MAYRLLNATVAQSKNFPLGGNTAIVFEIIRSTCDIGAWGGVVVKALHTSRTVPGSIPGGVTGFFSDISPSDRNMALRSTQSLVKMSTRNISWG
jgi:hypothetical protein